VKVLCSDPLLPDSEDDAFDLLDEEEEDVLFVLGVHFPPRWVEEEVVAEEDDDDDATDDDDKLLVVVVVAVLMLLFLAEEVPPDVNFGDDSGFAPSKEVEGDDIKSWVVVAVPPSLEVVPTKIDCGAVSCVICIVD